MHATEVRAPTRRSRSYGRPERLRVICPPAVISSAEEKRAPLSAGGTNHTHKSSCAMREATQSCPHCAHTLCRPHRTSPACGAEPFPISKLIPVCGDLWRPVDKPSHRFLSPAASTTSQLSPNPPMRSGLGVGTRGEGRGTRQDALDSDKWGRWRSWAAAQGRGRRDSMQGETIADRAGATLWIGWIVWWTGQAPSVPSGRQWQGSQSSQGASELGFPRPAPGEM